MVADPAAEPADAFSVVAPALHSLAEACDEILQVSRALVFAQHRAVRAARAATGARVPRSHVPCFAIERAAMKVLGGRELA